METKQTAVEWLINELENDYVNIDLKNIVAYNGAKQMEKEQIINAWENGFMSTGEGWNGEIPPECQGEVLDTEKYYNETYGKE